MCFRLIFVPSAEVRFLPGIVDGGVDRDADGRVGGDGVRGVRGDGEGEDEGDGVDGVEVEEVVEDEVDGGGLGVWKSSESELECESEEVDEASEELISECSWKETFMILGMGWLA